MLLFPQEIQSWAGLTVSSVELFSKVHISVASIFWIYAFSLVKLPKALWLWYHSRICINPSRKEIEG